MSNALAIAAVTAVLRDLLDSGMIDHDVTDAVGQGVAISASAPDVIALEGANAKPQINLFLHQVSHNAALRNMDLPARSRDGLRVSNAPLALDLHYLVTAYGIADLQAEILLGYAVQLLHETPMPSRDAIRTALSPPGVPVDGSLLPSAYEALRASDLAEQIEQIKITPVPMNGDEMSKIWSSLQAHYRPSVAYQVSVVLVQASRPARSALPVLTRGRRLPSAVDPAVLREAGVALAAGVLPSVPSLESIALPPSRTLAHLGDTVGLLGRNLAGVEHKLLLSLPRLGIEHAVDPVLNVEPGRVDVTIPDLPNELPAGNYLAALQLRDPSEPRPRSTGQLALAIAPEFTSLASPIATLDLDLEGHASVTVGCRPRVLPNQRASLLLGSREIFANPRALPSDTLTFEIENAPVGDHYVRLRVDGVDSQLVDLSQSPPAYLDRRMVVQ